MGGVVAMTIAGTPIMVLKAVSLTLQKVSVCVCERVRYGHGADEAHGR